MDVHPGMASSFMNLAYPSSAFCRPTPLAPGTVLFELGQTFSTKSQKR